MHLAFGAHRRQLWNGLGLTPIMEAASVVDGFGPVLIEELLQSPKQQLQGFQKIDVHEVVIITCWYLWWMRRQVTHGGSVPPLTVAYSPSLLRQLIMRRYSRTGWWTDKRSIGQMVKT